MTITIRPVTTVEGAEHFQRLEQLIWDTPPEDMVPVHVAITVVHNGGGLLGAFADDGPVETGGMVGLCFWWPGIGTPTTQAVPLPEPAPTPAPQLKMCSHMAGVLPVWQGTGIGLQLKLAQRAAILAQGFTDWVTWTYDPLLRTNAVFNIRRLGALCNTYECDLYGVMRDGLNAGTPSDRCQVDWWLRSERLASRALHGEGQRGATDQAPLPADLRIVPTMPAPAGFRAPVDASPALDGAALAVPIPDDIGTIRLADDGLGMAWRLFMRETLVRAFAAGYVITDCIRIPGTGWHYLLMPADQDGAS
jgi:chorismate synthase